MKLYAHIIHITIYLQTSISLLFHHSIYWQLVFFIWVSSFLIFFSNILVPFIPCCIKYLIYVFFLFRYRLLKMLFYVLICHEKKTRMWKDYLLCKESKTKTLDIHPLPLTVSRNYHLWIVSTVKFCAMSLNQRLLEASVPVVFNIGGTILTFFIGFWFCGAFSVCLCYFFDLKSHTSLINSIAFLIARTFLRRTGELRPITGPNVQRPRSKTNKLYYYQGYHDGSIKYKRKPPKGMYINHDDVLKLAAQDLNETMTPRKQPVPPKFDLLTETNREISVLHSQVSTSPSLFCLTAKFLFFSFLFFRFVSPKI